MYVVFPGENQIQAILKKLKFGEFSWFCSIWYHLSEFWR